MNRYSLSFAIGLFIKSWTVWGQMLGGSSPPALSASFSKLFGDVSGFSAKGEMITLDNKEVEIQRIPMDFFMLGNKVRMDVDCTQLKGLINGKKMSVEIAAQLKRVGMAQMISTLLPEKELIYFTYPDHKAVLKVRLPQGDIADTIKSKTEMSELAKDTIEGHVCKKMKVRVHFNDLVLLDAITWNAGDLKDFPIQIQVRQKDKIVRFVYRDIQITKPDEKQFEVPSDYKQYLDMNLMLEDFMKRASGGPWR